MLTFEPQASFTTAHGFVFTGKCPFDIPWHEVDELKGTLFLVGNIAYEVIGISTFACMAPNFKDMPIAILVKQL